MKHSQAFLLFLLQMLSTVYAFMPGMGMMNPMMPGMPMNPMMGMNPMGMQVYRKRRHRNWFQRMTGTGQRYNYYMRPGMGMMSPMMPGMGMSSMTMSTMHPMTPMMMGGTANVALKSGVGRSKRNVMSSSTLAHACRARSTLALRYVNCPYMTAFDVNHCINSSTDAFVTALVKKCKGFFTKNPYQMAAYAMELILANKPMAFGYLVTQGTCSMMGRYELDLMLKTAVLARTANTFAFVDYILNTCNVSIGQLAWLQTQALMAGDLPTATRLQRAATFPTARQLDSQPNLVYLPSGRVISLRNNAALTVLNGRDMSTFGKIGRLCSYLRAEHLTHPLFPIELLSEMNENCFHHLKPKLFFYFTADMIKRLRWWKLATPLQMRMILPGPPIQSVPFYLLGQHNYINKLDRKHPCAGISKIQRMSIQMQPKLARAFYERCRAAASSASSIGLSTTAIVSLLLAGTSIFFF